MKWFWILSAFPHRQGISTFPPGAAQASQGSAPQSPQQQMLRSAEGSQDSVQSTTQVYATLNSSLEYHSPQLSPFSNVRFNLQPSMLEIMF